MSIALITPNTLEGTMVVPPSKSDAHRAIICAALSDGISEIFPIEISNDIMATINAIKAIGAKVRVIGDRLLVDGSSSLRENYAEIDCCDSASTLRFLLPVVCCRGIRAKFKGSKGLKARPMKNFTACFQKAGINFSFEGEFPSEVFGMVSPGRFSIPGNISSQFISGLLLALPMLSNDSEIYLTTPLESAKYVEMTINTMQKFGVKIEKTSYGYRVPGKQTYSAQNYKVEGDWSQAAFFMAAGAIAGKIRIKGLNMNSVQADKQILAFLQRVGANIEHDEDDIIVSKGDLKACDIYANQNPDLIPILAVVASMCKGASAIFNASRLRFKESDRLRALCSNLKKMGVDVKEMEDGLLIVGEEKLKGTSLDGFNDHRIVMAMAIAAICAKGKVLISNAESICKSYPSFFEHYNQLGGVVDVIDI